MGEAAGLPRRAASPRRGHLQPRSRIGFTIEAPRSVQESSAPASRLAIVLATAGGVGYAPWAPGTAGAALGVGLHLPLAALGPWLYALAVLGLLSLGLWASEEAERAFARRDDGRIVIDEVVGQLVALAPLPILGLPARPSLLVTGFVAFRCFDVWKPGPVGRVERRLGGGPGVMMDDVVAGGLAALAVALVAAVLA